MNLAIYYIIFIFTLLFIGTAYFLAARYIKNRKHLKAILYSLGVFLMLLSFTRFYGGHDYLEYIKEFNSNILNPFETVLSLLSTWSLNAATFMVGFCIFFNTKNTRIIVKYVASILLIFNIFTLKYTIIGNTETLDFIITNAIYSYRGFNFRAFIIPLEIAIASSLCINLWIKERTLYVNRNNVKAIIIAICLAIFVCFPTYIADIFFKDLPSTIRVEDFNFYHRLVLYGAFILPIIYYLTLKNFEYEDKRYLMILIAIYSFLSFSSVRRYEVWTSWYSLPLHLCNTAMYIIPLTLMFKTHKVFYFTMYINVIGALIALFIPKSEDYMYINLVGENVLNYTALIEFYVNHYYAFFMPLLTVALKLYERPRTRFFTYSMIGFFFYYVGVLVINVVNAANGHPTNYFFINGTFIPETLGKWCETIFDIDGNTWRTLNIVIGDKTYTFKWLYQLLFYLVYVGLALLMWILYSVLFKTQDSIDDLLDKITFRKNEKRSFYLVNLDETKPVIEQDNFLFKLKEFYLIRDLNLNKANKKEIAYLTKDLALCINYNYDNVSHILKRQITEKIDNYFDFKKEIRAKYIEKYLIKKSTLPYNKKPKNKEIYDIRLSTFKEYRNHMNIKKKEYKEEISYLTTLRKENQKAYKSNKNIAKLKYNERISTLLSNTKEDEKIMKNINSIYLELKNFSKIYEGSKEYAVKDFSLKVEGGKIHGFLGQNGAGKSTIIKSIVGIHDFNEGSINVCGFDIKKDPVSTKKCIGYVPDHYALYENLTGREYVNYIADLYNVSQKDRNEIIENLVERFNLKHRFDYPIKTYSHGMKQKITIISALVHNPPLWILDEPLTGLDPNSIYEVKECMREHAKKGNIVFFSSHLIDIVENLCDDITIIKKGNLICNKNINELKEQNINLEHLYLEKIGEKVTNE